MTIKYYDSDIAEQVFDILFSLNLPNLNFINTFPHAELNRDFAYIKLNDEFVIKIERL